ncbi:MAG: DUF5662 family protein [bacterium]
MDSVLKHFSHLFEDQTSGLEPLLKEFVENVSGLLPEEQSARKLSISEYYKTILNRSSDVKFAYDKTREWANNIYVRSAVKKIRASYGLPESKNEKEQWFEERTNKHIELVKKYANKIAKAYPEFNELVDQVETHDLTKFEEPERTPYIEITWKNKINNNNDRKTPGLLPDKKENDATLYHVKNNQHHPEFWSEDEANISDTDRNVSIKCIDASKMPDLHVAEMVADWQAMSEELGTNTARQWFEKVKDTRWHFSSDQEQLIDKLLKVSESVNETDNHSLYIDDIIFSIKQRMKLRRRDEAIFDPKTNEAINGGWGVGEFPGVITVAGVKYNIKLHRYSPGGLVELEYITKIREIKEAAFGSYEYHASKDKSELMMDFFLLASLPTPPDENLAFVLADVRKDTYAQVKKEMLYAVQFAVSAEFRHFLDSNSKEDIVEFFRSKGKEDFLSKYMVFFGGLKSSITSKFVTAKSLDIERLRKSEKDNDEARKASYQAIKATKIPSIDFMKLASDAFGELHWSSMYGGPKWESIADAWISLYYAESDRDLVTYIDHVYDLQHNTSTVFNKLHSYYKNSSYEWIKKALDYKYSTESLYDLFGITSPDLQRFAAAVIKDSQGTTVEEWLSQGGNFKGYEDGEKFYVGAWVKYTGPNQRIHGKIGKIFNKDKGTYDIQFTSVNEAHDGQILIKGILIVGSLPGIITIQHQHPTSGTSTVYVGSYLKVTRIS